MLSRGHSLFGNCLNMCSGELGKKGTERIAVGFCGYPNVGKSSTINKLMQEKKVTVSATPGKTKHFQSLFLNDEICLLDCECCQAVRDACQFARHSLCAKALVWCSPTL